MKKICYIVTLPVTIKAFFIPQLKYLSNKGFEVSLKAKSKKGSVYDEVYVDDDALYDLIIQTFYTEEQSEGESK